MVRITINPKISYTPIDDEMVILGEKNSQVYGLTPMGTAIFTLLEQRAMSFDELCITLLEKYQVTSEQCEFEAKQFIQKMCENNLLQIRV